MREREICKVGDNADTENRVCVSEQSLRCSNNDNSPTKVLKQRAIAAQGNLMQQMDRRDGIRPARQIQRFQARQRASASRLPVLSQRQLGDTGVLGHFQMSIETLDRHILMDEIVDTSVLAAGLSAEQEVELAKTTARTPPIDRREPRPMLKDAILICISQLGTIVWPQMRLRVQETDPGSAHESKARSLYWRYILDDDAEYFSR